MNIKSTFNRALISLSLPYFENKLKLVSMMRYSCLLPVVCTCTIRSCVSPCWCLVFYFQMFLSSKVSLYHDTKLISTICTCLIIAHVPKILEVFSSSEFSYECNAHILIYKCVYKIPSPNFQRFFSILRK